MGVYEKDQLNSTIRRATLDLEQDQTSQGYWDACFDTGVMADAQTAISLYLLGIEDADWIQQILQNIRRQQRSDGTWGIHPREGSDLSTTVECYYALEIYRAWNELDPMKALSETYIIKYGGLRMCRNLTKMFLAIGGEIPWHWLPSPRIYSWLFAKYTPVQIGHLTTFTKLHIAPMIVLSSLQYQSHSVDDSLLSHFITSKRNRSAAPQGQQKVCRPFPWHKARFVRCVRWMLEEREDDGSVAGYHSSTLLMLFAMRGLGLKNMNPARERSVLQSIKSNVYQSDNKEFAHQQTCNGHVWNTSLALNTLLDVGQSSDSVVARRAARYLFSKQHESTGAWGFSSNNTKHPDVDDTVSCLTALIPYRNGYFEMWNRGFTWLLSMQNQDGGWSAFERNSNRRWLERLPANDMKHAMIDPSTADITARVVCFLRRHAVPSECDTAIQKGATWLLKHQKADGSWYGRWGSTYLYGTWCVVSALADLNSMGCREAMTRAAAWLLSIQHGDGRFGESHESELRGKYIPHDTGIPTQTAWGLDALIHLLKAEREEAMRQRLVEAIDRAAAWILNHAREGKWMDELPTGTAFPGALHIRYHIYPKVWPLVALVHYKMVLESEKLKGGEKSVGSEFDGNLSRKNRQSAVLAQNVSNSPMLQ